MVSVRVLRLWGWGMLGLGVIAMLGGSWMALVYFPMAWFSMAFTNKEAVLSMSMWEGVRGSFRYDHWIYLAMTRTIWQIWPNIVTAGLFMAMFWVYLFLPSREPSSSFKPSVVHVVSSGVALSGIILNQLVIMFNGGFMPVVASSGTFSVWVTATDAHRLLWLADRFHGFSVGDLLLIGSLTIMAAEYACSKVKRRHFASSAPIRARNAGGGLSGRLGG